jgi:squalene monooxygenase
MEDKDRCFDLAIVGAGIAGSALAAYLSTNSRLKILLVEKDWREPDRIVGELLQPGGVEILKSIGLQHCLEGFDAQDIVGYAIFKNGEHFTIAYPKNAEGEHFKGKGFHNGKFLQRLRGAARLHPNITALEGEVTSLVGAENEIRGVEVKMKSGDPQRYAAKLTVVTDGIFSSFRNELCESQKEVTGYFLGLILKGCPLPFPHHGHVFTGGKSPFLAYPISSTETRMLIDFPGSQPPRKGDELHKFLLEQIMPQLPVAMHPSFIAAVQEAKFKTMPNHYLPAKPKQMKGAVVLGDALNMRHPLTGGGMTVALTDVKILGELILQTAPLTPENIQRCISSFYDERSTSDATINILANALYKVFSHEALSDACFSYLKQGGKQAAQPVELLSAISRDRQLLLKHFFAVAAHGAGKKIWQNPSPATFRNSLGMIGDAVKIVSPLLQNEQPGKAEKFALWLGKKAFAQ